MHDGTVEIGGMTHPGTPVLGENPFWRYRHVMKDHGTVVRHELVTVSLHTQGGTVPSSPGLEGKRVIVSVQMDGDDETEKCFTKSASDAIAYWPIGSRVTCEWLPDDNVPAAKEN